MRYKGRFQDAETPLVLAAKEKVVVTFSANNLVVLKMAIVVFDSKDKELFSAGQNEGSPELSSADGTNTFAFVPEQLAGAAYVKWALWAENASGAAVNFDVTVRVTQGGASNDSVKAYSMAAGELQRLLETTGDWLDIEKADKVPAVAPAAAPKKPAGGKK